MTDTTSVIEWIAAMNAAERDLTPDEVTAATVYAATQRGHHAWIERNRCRLGCWCVYCRPSRYEAAH
jgi:hypothetical protein